VSVDHEFWHGRWEEGFTPWHQGRVNRCLERHFSLLNLADDILVFVPLCGKAVDMRWLLEHRCRVLGIDLSERAAREFFADNGLRYAEREEGAFTVLEGAGATIFCGDVFELTDTHLAGIGAVYDRAALSALDEDDRRRYAAHLTRILPPGTAQLVITLDYDTSRMTGPPFAVTPDEMQRHYAGRFGIRLLDSSDVIHEEPRFRERGLDVLTEHAFLLLDA
jgi:thiopurine S-methyltransferase